MTTSPAPTTVTATPATERPNFETSAITTLRRALLENADHYQQHATSIYPDAKPEAGDPTFLAWSTLSVSSAYCRLLAGLLGVIDRDEGAAADRRAEARGLIGPFLDGWGEVVDVANEDLSEQPAQVPGQQGIPAPRAAVFADEAGAMHFASGDRVECGAPGGHRATCLASVTCRDCLDAFHTPAATGSGAGR